MVAISLVPTRLDLPELEGEGVTESLLPWAEVAIRSI